jgi:hypothetical protein
MITTVTTTTTTTVTTLAATTLTLIVILTLIGLLIQKEVISGLDGAVARRVGRVLNIAIIPLSLVFVCTIAIKVFDLLH